MYCPWSDENGYIYDNQNVPIDWNCMSDDPGYRDQNFFFYAHANQDAAPSTQAGDIIEMWYQETEGGGDIRVCIYLPDGADWDYHLDAWGYVNIYVDSNGNTYWDEDLCDTAYENFAPTPPPTPTPTPTSTPTPTPTPTSTPSVTPTTTPTPYGYKTPTPTPTPSVTPTPTPTSVPTATPDYSPPSLPPSQGDSAQYVIITTDELLNTGIRDSFESLEIYRRDQGMNGTAIVTIEDIASFYQGTRPDGGIDLQTKIREFIKDAYDNWETDYIVLGGDTTVIPTRYFINNQGNAFVPADMYYSCLYSAQTGDPDSGFDNNGNGIYGEPTDGPNGSDVDASSEVRLGRIAVEYPDEIKNIVKKIIKYETSSEVFLHKLLFMTAFSFYQDPSRLSMTGLKWGTDSINGFNKQPFHSEFRSLHFDNSPLSKEEIRQLVVDTINEDNNHMIFNEGHGGVFYGMQIATISDSGELAGLGDLTNNNPFFAYGYGCHPGSYDYLVGPGKSLASFNYPPFGVVIGDFNQGEDGHLDVAATFPDDNSIKLGFGNGDGTFASFTPIAQSADGLDGPTWIIKDHFNSDPYWDFAVVNSEGASFSVLTSDGFGGYTVVTYSTLPENPNHLTAIDFDGDSDPDLAVTTVSGSMGIYLYENDNGSFSYFTGMTLPWAEMTEEATYITAGKFNSDNNADIAVTSDGDKVYVVFGDGDGTFSDFTSFPVGTNPRYICAGDFDQDDYDDFAVACYNSEIWVWLSDEANPGSFSSQTYYGTNNVNFISAEADLNKDGYLDIIITGAGFRLFLGRPLGKFIPNRGGYKNINGGRCGAVGDVDEDGNYDVIISKASDPYLYKALSTEDACFFEELINMEHGGFGAFAYAHYGGGWRFIYEFVDAITRERVAELGELFDRSREENIDIFSGLRDLFYYQHLFGDPAVKIRFNEIPFILDNGDFNGDGSSDIAVYRSKWDSSESSIWEIKDLTQISFGTKNDLPANGDYNGDGTTDIAIFDRITALWEIRGVTQFYFGDPGIETESAFTSSKDIPAPGDFNGDGTTDAAVYRPSESLWSIRGMTSFSFGDHMDLPVILDYNGDGSDDIAAFRPSTGDWLIREITTLAFGTDGDLPIPTDFNGDGTEEIAVYRPSTNLWAVKDFTEFYFGDAAADFSIPIPADYDGDGTADIAIFEPVDGLWQIKDMTQLSHGTYVDFPVTR